MVSFASPERIRARVAAIGALGLGVACALPGARVVDGIAEIAELDPAGTHDWGGISAPAWAGAIPTACLAAIAIGLAIRARSLERMLALLAGGTALGGVICGVIAFAEIVAWHPGREPFWVFVGGSVLAGLIASPAGAIFGALFGLAVSPWAVALRTLAVRPSALSVPASAVLAASCVIAGARVARGADHVLDAPADAIVAIALATAAIALVELARRGVIALRVRRGLVAGHRIVRVAPIALSGLVALDLPGPATHALVRRVTREDGPYRGATHEIPIARVRM